MAVCALLSVGGCAQMKLDGQAQRQFRDEIASTETGWEMTHMDTDYPELRDSHRVENPNNVRIERSVDRHGPAVVARGSSYVEHLAAARQEADRRGSLTGDYDVSLFRDVNLCTQYEDNCTPTYHDGYSIRVEYRYTTTQCTTINRTTTCHPVTHYGHTRHDVLERTLTGDQLHQTPEAQRLYTTFAAARQAPLVAHLAEHPQ